MTQMTNKQLGEMTHEAHQFLLELLDPEVWGHAVSKEVRNEARKILGMTVMEK